MDVSGDVADLMVKESIQLTEASIKLLAAGSKNLAALLWAVVLVAGVTAVFATSPAPTAEEIAKLPLATRGDLPKNAPSSPSEDRVHPMTGEAAPSSSSAGRASRPCSVSFSVPSPPQHTIRS